MAVTLASGDVSGNLPSDTKAWNGSTLPTVGTSTLTAQQVWEYGTRGLTTFGSLVADIATAVWGASQYRCLWACFKNRGLDRVYCDRYRGFENWAERTTER